MSGRTGVGIVGAGRAGAALAVALARAGGHVRAVSSRDPARRASLAASLTGVRLVDTPGAVAAIADVVLLAVPDDVLGEVASDLRPRAGSVVAHLSGVHPAGVLRDALGPGVAVGSFHPLVAFADLERAVAALRGAWVAIDGDIAAVGVLDGIAGVLGMRPVVVAAGPDPARAKAAHHAAAVLAAGGLVALVDAVVELGRVAGLDEAAAVDVYGSLMAQGLANVGDLGVSGALTGPVARGDAGTVRAHLAAIDARAPDVRDLYLALARRQLAMVRARGRLAPERAAELGALLDDG